VKVQETEEFLQLANKLQGELGRLILQSLDMLSLFNELQFLIISILSRDGEIESDHRLIIENGCKNFILFTSHLVCLIIQLVLYDTERCQAEFLTSLKTH
jgi:hypothetical protein